MEVVIVTGSCGRIGTNVIQKLGQKFQIIGFELEKTACVISNEIVIRVDLSSDESVNEAFFQIGKKFGRRIASVVHLAAYYSFD